MGAAMGESGEALAPAGWSSRGFLRGPMAASAVMSASRCRRASISACCICNQHRERALDSEATGTRERTREATRARSRTSLARCLSFACSGSSTFERLCATSSQLTHCTVVRQGSSLERSEAGATLAYFGGAQDGGALALLARALLGAVELLEHSQLLLHLAGRLVHAAEARLVLRTIDSFLRAIYKYPYERVCTLV